MLSYSQKPQYNFSNTSYLKNRIRACITLEKWNVVSETFNELNMSEVQDPEVEYLSALFAYKHDGDIQKAIRGLQRGIREEIEFLNCWLLLGELFWQQKNHNEAVNCFFKVICYYFTCKPDC